MILKFKCWEISRVSQKMGLKFYHMGWIKNPFSSTSVTFNANPKLLVQPVFILTTNTKTLLICTLKRTSTDTTTHGFSITKKFPHKYPKNVNEVTIMYFQHSETEFKQHCSELFKMLKNPMEEESLTPRTLGPGSTSLIYYHSLGDPLTAGILW